MRRSGRRISRGSRTLHFTGSHPGSGLLVWTLLFFGIFTLAGEALVRTNLLESRLGPRSVGSEHRTLEEQWSRLERFVDERGAVDCIFVGDSTVMSDFAPLPFSESYLEKYGRELMCYNFGVGAFSMLGTATLAKLLGHEFSPRLILVGLEPLNFTVPREEQGAADLASIPWVGYRMGEFSLEGWAFDHIHLLGYLRTLGRILLLRIQDSGILLDTSGVAVTSNEGYYPVQGTGRFDVSKPPAPDINDPYLEHYFAAHANFELLPENIEALEQLLGMNDSVQITLVEMPLAPTFQAFFGNGAEDYMEFVTTVSEKASAYGVPFYRMSEPDLLSPNLWYNYNHLNADGAPIFSRWLGQEIGATVQAEVP